MASDLPTKDEQLRLRETQNLMSVGILQLQMDEMLAETKMLRQKSSSLRGWLSKFANIFTEISFSSEFITPLWLRNEGVAGITFRDQNTSISIMPPKEVRTIGSFPLQTGTHPFCNIDFVVSLPADYFTDRDILNHTYFDKRNLYVGYLLWFLSKQSNLIQEASIGYLKNDERKPVIVVEPKIQTTYSVRIFVAAPDNVFKLNQLRPSKNNVRPSWWIDILLRNRNEDSRNNDVLDPNSLTPTPHYNMAILEDVMILKAHDYLVHFFEKCPWICDIIIAVKVWLTQRELRWGIDTLDGHSVLFFLIYLSLSGVILPHMTPLTGFMTFLKYLMDLPSVSCLSLGKRLCCGAFPLELYLPAISEQSGNAFDVYNFLWRISSSALTQLKEHASSSLQLLQASSAFESSIATSSFRSVFLWKDSFVENYDLIFHISCVDRKSVSSLCSKDVAEQTLLQLDNLTSWQYTSESARSLAQEGLGNRAAKVHACSQPQSLVYRQFTSIFPVSGVDVIIGVIFNSVHMHRRVERGPVASDETACAKFKQFWGQKSEMRRFKDGSIVEAVVWSDHDFGVKLVQPSVLISEIIKYILHRHMPFCSNIRISADYLAELLPLNSQYVPVINTSLSSCSHHSPQQLFSRAIEATDVLRRILTSNLKGFPLVIEHIRPISGALRYTSLFPPPFNPLLSKSISTFSGGQINPVSTVLSIVAHLQKSSRWPADSKAAASLKSALLVKLSCLLENQFSILSVIHSLCLDIFFEGYLFRLYLFTDQELPLLAPQLDDFTTVRHATIQATCSKQFTSFYRSMVVDPQHHLAIHALCSKYESFSDTVRLLSFWVDVQSLSGYLEPQLLELIVASVYLPCRSSVNIPHCPTFGLLKSLLRIAEHDWQNHPLLVDLSFCENERQNSTFLDHAFSEFTALRHFFNGGPCFAIAGKYDRNDCFYFDYGVSMSDYSIQNILITAAKLSVRNIVDYLCQVTVRPPMSMIVTAPPSFDMTIFFIKSSFPNRHLDKTAYDYSQLLNGPEHVQIEILQNIPLETLPNKICVSEENLPHPFQSEYVAILRQEFSHVALFFYNQLEGRQVGVVWKPHAFASRGFTALHSRHRTVVHESLVVPNISSIISEIVFLGKGIVERVQMK